MNRTSYARKTNKIIAPNNLVGMVLIALALIISSCLPLTDANTQAAPQDYSEHPEPTYTLYPQRPEYYPGELVDYVARSGDTLPALAARFNTTVEEIRSANVNIPEDATTLPPGMPMQVPIYYRSFWGTPYVIMPENLFVNGPSAIGFDVEDYIQKKPGWLKDYQAYAQGGVRSGAEVVEIVATNYSIDPRVLLAVLEYSSGALSQPIAPEDRYPLGINNYYYPGLYMQLIWVANTLNHGFYGWRTGILTEFELENGQIERPDPWQTSASVAFQYLFSRIYNVEKYRRSVSEDGIGNIFTKYFGDPWAMEIAHIPVSLQQPSLTLPFLPGDIWALTGGPHTGWGTLYPWAALDFAPGSEESGCSPTTLPAVAVADGLVVRSETGVVMLDLDGDGDERTGWVILYLHVATFGRVPMGSLLSVGEVVGYPSCEGGTATGTHIHIARKFNGEWIPAGGVIPFNLDGWLAHIGDYPYDGNLTRNGRTIEACTCSDISSQIEAGE